MFGSGPTPEYLADLTTRAKNPATSSDSHGPDRRRDAFQPSEQSARREVEALTYTLDALVRETSTDRLAEPVLGTIAWHFDAHSVTVWLVDQTRGRAGFAFEFSGGRFRNAADAMHPAARLPVDAQDFPVWRQIITTKQFYICPDPCNHPLLPPSFRNHNRATGIETILIVPMLIARNVVGMVAMRFASLRYLRSEEIELAHSLVNQATLAIRCSASRSTPSRPP